jgi:hypothetical protein
VGRSLLIFGDLGYDVAAQTTAPAFVAPVGDLVDYPSMIISGVPITLVVALQRILITIDSVVPIAGAGVARPAVIAEQLQLLTRRQIAVWVDALGRS